MKRLLPGWINPPAVDLPLLLGLLVVMAAGLGVLWSASGAEAGMVGRQAARLGLGIALMLAVTMVPPRMLRMWTPWLYAGSLFLLVLTALIGVGQGAQRWLDFSVVRFQPSELMKLAGPMMVAWYLHPRPLPPGWKAIGVTGLILAVPAVLIAWQPDLGTALLIAAAGCFTLFLAGLSWRFILALGVAAVAAMPLLWMVMHDYQKHRVHTFLDPEADPLGQGWNIIQSMIAVGSGGLTGKGWLAGTQARLEFIPERHTDFILAVLAEEFGLVGVLALFAAYLFLVGRGLFLAAQARDTWSRLVAGSLAMTLLVYVLVNGGMVAGVLPVVGVPLPLVSFGGTSAVTLLVSFGVIMAAATPRRTWK